MEKPKTSLSVEEYLVGKTGIIHSSTVWKFEEFSPTIFLKKFRQSNFSTKELVIDFTKIGSGINFRHYRTVSSRFKNIS